MRHIFVSIAIVFCFLVSAAVAEATEYDIVRWAVPYGTGFSHFDANLNCSAGVYTGGKPRFLYLLDINMNNVELMRDPEGRLTWIAKAKVQHFFVPKGCELKSSATIPPIVPQTSKVAKAQIVPVETASAQSFLSLLWLALALLAVLLLGSYLAYRIARRRALARNPYHPVFQGPGMRFPLLPQTAGARRENLQRIVAQEDSLRGAVGLPPLGAGTLVEIIRVQLSSDSPVMTEYRDYPRMAIASGQTVYVGVYRDAEGQISNVAVAFNGCANGMLLSRMSREQVQRFMRGARWSNSNRIWVAASHTAAMNWAEVERFMRENLPRMLDAHHTAGTPITATAGGTTVSSSTSTSASAPVTSSTASATAAIPATASTASLVPSFALTSAQRDELISSGEARRVTLRPDQITALALLGVPMVVEGPAAGSAEGVVVRYLGFGPSGLPEYIRATVQPSPETTPAVPAAPASTSRRRSAKSGNSHAEPTDPPAAS